VPLTDRSEAAAITLLHGSGLDWRTTLKELAARHGITEHYGRKMVPLPPVSSLSNQPLAFLAPCTTALENHPVSYATTTYLVHDDAEKNHAEIVSQIRMRLGPGSPGNEARTLHEEWRFGRIVISAITWPPEKQAPGGTNLLHEIEPRLRFATTITVQSDFAYIFPFADLAAVFDSSDTRFLDLSSSPGVVASPSPSLLTRVNPPLCKDRITEDGWRVWRNDTRGWLGVSNRDTTALFERGTQPSLILSKLEPARGPGGASLRVKATVEAESISIFQSPATHGLDALAEKIAVFWELPLSTTREPDE
jgi:hypothetical protein